MHKKQSVKKQPDSLSDEIRTAREILQSWAESRQHITLAGIRAILEAVVILIEAAEVHAAHKGE